MCGIDILVCVSRYGRAFFITLLRKTNAELEDRVRKRTAQLAASKEAAEAASQAKSDFLANVSHELRTPMNGIMGMLEMALDSELSEEVDDYLQTARSSARAMMTVISDVLDFSRLDARQLNLRWVQFSVVDYVATALQSLEQAAGGKGLTVLSDVAPGVPQTLLGDPLRMGQIVSNLLGNAIKFTERGQVAVHVEATSEAGENIELHFDVSDTGIGIPPGKQQQIFECFTQVDTSSTRKHGGLGLGLTICSKLVKEMGGQGGCWQHISLYGLSPARSASGRCPDANLGLSSACRATLRLLFLLALAVDGF